MQAQRAVTAMLSAKAIGEQLGLSARKIYDLAANGALVSYRFGDAVRFDQADVDAYKASCRQQPSPAIGVHTRTQPVSLSSADSSLAMYFRAAGLKPRTMPASAKPQRGPRKAAPCSRPR
jgi:excisionase family DNA binding protein